MNSKNNGITLVALIITIIILLILAGITIGMLTQNGLFENAKTAKEKYENSQERENEILFSYESEISSSREQITVDKAEYEQLLRDVASLKTNSIKYPDYTNKIKTITEVGGSWKATEDCICVAKLRGQVGMSGPKVYVDDVEILGLYNSAMPTSDENDLTVLTGTFFVKKGSIISTRNTSTVEYSIDAYALQK